MRTRRIGVILSLLRPAWRLAPDGATARRLAERSVVAARPKSAPPSAGPEGKLSHQPHSTRQAHRCPARARSRPSRARSRPPRWNIEPVITGPMGHRAGPSCPVPAVDDPEPAATGLLHPGAGDDYCWTTVVWHNVKLTAWLCDALSSFARPGSSVRSRRLLPRPARVRRLASIAGRRPQSWL